MAGPSLRAQVEALAAIANLARNAYNQQAMMEVLYVPRFLVPATHNQHAAIRMSAAQTAALPARDYCHHICRTLSAVAARCRLHVVCCRRTLSGAAPLYVRTAMCMRLMCYSAHNPTLFSA